MKNVIALALLVSIAALAIPATASYVNIVSPYNYTVTNNGSVALGNVGPGQTFYVTISAATVNATGKPLPLDGTSL